MSSSYPSFRAFLFKSEHMTVASADERVSAIARPLPELDPVTMAICFGAHPMAIGNLFRWLYPFMVPFGLLARSKICRYQDDMIPRSQNRIGKACALVAATLILPALAYSQSQKPPPQNPPNQNGNPQQTPNQNGNPQNPK